VSRALVSWAVIRRLFDEPFLDQGLVMASFCLRMPALASEGRLLARVVADVVRRNWILFPEAEDPRARRRHLSSLLAPMAA